MNKIYTIETNADNTEFKLTIKYKSELREFTVNHVYTVLSQSNTSIKLQCKTLFVDANTSTLQTTTNVLTTSINELSSNKSKENQELVKWLVSLK